MSFLVRRVGAGPWLRVAISALVIAVAVAGQHPAAVLPGSVALVLLELLSPAVLKDRARLTVELLVVTLTVGLSVAYTPAALPLLLVTAFRAGETLDGRQVLLERLACAVATPFWLVVLSRSNVDQNQLLVPLIQWWTLGLALGLLAAWAKRVQPSTPESIQRLAAVEASRLSGQLQSIAKQLPLGLDATAVGQALLDDVYALTSVDICAVLLGSTT